MWGKESGSAKNRERRWGYENSRKKEYSRVEDVGGVVHALLEGAVCVGEGLCGTAEAHVLAEVVAALGAVGAVVAHDTCLDRDALADDEVLDTGANGGDDACSFVAEDEGRLDDEVAVAAVGVVVDWRGARRVSCGRSSGGSGARSSRSLPQRPVAITATWA